MKHLRYYCESCGSEVRKNAKLCPRCGRFFSSVKCPRCGHVGEVRAFALGCPVCGYADAGKPEAAASRAERQPASASEPLPRWVLPLAASVLVCLVLLLLRILR